VLQVGAIKGQLFHRKDVGTDALVAQRVQHMLSLHAARAPVTGPQRLVKVGVLGSTRGSSLQPVLRAISSGELPGIQISLVLSNKSDAPILTRAANHGIPYAHVPCKKGTPRAVYDAMLSRQLEAAGCEVRRRPPDHRPLHHTVGFARTTLPPPPHVQTALLS